LEGSVFMGYRTTYSRLIGALFIAGFVVYGAGFGLTSSVLGVPDFLSTISAHQSTLVLGAFLMLLVAPVGVGNGLILGFLMYTSGLVPRAMALLGLIGGPLIIASGLGVLFGVIEAGGVVQLIATLPEFLWEGFVLGIWLTVRGFNPSAVARL
jgi:hypothetical protein